MASRNPAPGRVRRKAAPSPFNAALEPIDFPLPPAVAEGVGRIIARHSYLEWVLGQVLYSLLEISIKQGRKVVQRPDPRQYVAAVEGLFAFHRIETRFDFAALGRRIEAADGVRDALAHSVFMRDVNARAARVHLVRGSWAIGIADESVRRDTWPDAPVVDAALLTEMRDRVERAVAGAEKLRAETDRRLRRLHEGRRTDPRLNRRGKR
ncbi:MAG TPA: hypothetical protein VEC19_08250 [Usitatibacter sp.]|nr:hypothetical protein [Usitatibacter sp.]